MASLGFIGTRETLVIPRTQFWGFGLNHWGFGKGWDKFGTLLGQTPIFKGPKKRERLPCKFGLGHFHFKASLVVWAIIYPWEVQVLHFGP